MSKLWLVSTDCTDPYRNLALEELLLNCVPEDGIILYLWQNDHTVVIGRNQNPWTECRLPLLEQDGGKLARRLSGGGAVYHDLGNLNFTFLCPEEKFDLQKQLQVVREAVQNFGIPVSFSGRNDLLVQESKFSGNAFYHSKGFAYHHGTILIRTDLDRLQRYLSPPKAKLESKGIASVRSRVKNLSEFSPTLTCQAMKEAMVAAFAQVYGGQPQPYVLTPQQSEQVLQSAQRYASHDWLLGKPLPFTCSMEGHFPWGHLQLHLQVENGHIHNSTVYTDAMDAFLAETISNALQGQAFSLEDMTRAVSGLSVSDSLAALFASSL